MARIIQSPGVQISEVDLSLRANLAAATNILIPGFAPKGPSSDPVQVSTLSEFEQIFGTPTNAAERYFYQTAKAVFQSPANVTCYRIPYGNGAGLGTTSQYSALVYPVATATLSATSTGIATITATNLSYPASASGVTYFFGAPTHVTLNESDYLSVLRGDAFTWNPAASDPTFNGLTSSGAVSAYNQTPTTTFANLSSLGQAGLIVLNKAQASINSRFEGTYVGIVDNTALNPATQYDDFSLVQSVNTNGYITPSNYVTVPSQRLTFSLSATTLGANGSVSEVVENLATFDTSPVQFNDTINLGVFKLRQSVFSPDTIQLDYVLQEGFNASFDYYRQINNPNGGAANSYFIEQAESNSKNIVALVNPYISNKNSTTWLNLSGTPNKSVRFLNSARGIPLASDVINLGGTSTAGVLSGGDTFATRMGATTGAYASLVTTFGNTNSLVALGDYAVENVTTKTIGDVPTKVSTMLNYVENADLYPLSIVCEAGLGTIYANTCNTTTSGYFDDSVPYTGSDVAALTAQDGTGASAPIALNYKAVVSQFVNFAAQKRKDHLFIADPLTNIFVQAGVKTLNDPNANFSSNIYWPLFNQFSFINNSYTATYANVVQVPDQSSSRLVWVPFSGFAAAIMANTDANYQPWIAPAGFRRGVINGITDVALYPKQKQRDQLYKISLNPIAFFPNEGYVVYGQKTMSKLPSAFDRINVRRLFLTLENQTNNVAKYYVFEPNTLFTRTQVKNVLAPIFDNAKNTQGLYDYLLICDERNNTPSVIDDNSLVIDIYIKPVRTAEFILVNFYATRTNQNFAEIVG
jgi:hypothetical protein